MKLFGSAVLIALLSAGSAFAQVDTSMYPHSSQSGINPFVVQALNARRQAELLARQQRAEQNAQAEAESQRQSAAAAQVAQQSASDQLAALIAQGKCDEARRLSVFYNRQDLTAATDRACSTPQGH